MNSFSQLSDDLLIKIISFVPIKDAVATSMLSKRWLSLWRLVPRLVFGEYEDEPEDEDEEANENHDKSLPQLVSGTLLLHKAAVLESFHLNIASECSASLIGLWVSVVVDRFVRDLKISFCYDYGLVKLPSSLFRCETIETLKLNMVILSQVPSRSSFPSLKKLSLVFVKYPDEESFSRLISNCPVLEDLAVKTCPNDNVVTFTINVASLQSLSIENATSDSPVDVFMIHCHSLKQLNIIEYFGEVYLIGNLSRLVDANLQSYRHAKLLESFTFVKRLYLCLEEKLQYPIGTVLFQLLRLEICCCEDNWTNMLVSVLQHSPKLQVLKLVLYHGPAVHRNVCWFEPICVPECFLYHLKTFEWRDYGGTEIEKAVAMYILKNARQLATATIYPDSLTLECEPQMFEELEIASRGSRACELTMH